MVFSPRPAAHPFALNDQHGRRETLRGFSGSAVALFFGYTHCTDVCPQTLALLGAARARAHLLPQKLRIVMISVDRKRDTPAAFEAFFRRAGVRALGLSGSGGQLRAVYRAYGIAASTSGTAVSHTSTIFLIDPRGRLAELLDPSMPEKAVAEDLRTVVQ